MKPREPQKMTGQGESHAIHYHQVQDSITHNLIDARHHLHDRQPKTCGDAFQKPKPSGSIVTHKQKGKVPGSLKK
jgi:hypothetical protein